MKIERCDGGCGKEHRADTDFPDGWIEVSVYERRCGRPEHFQRAYCPPCWDRIGKSLREEMRRPRLVPTGDDVA